MNPRSTPAALSSSSIRGSDATSGASAPMWRWPLAYLLTALVFLAMDGVWLSATQATFYKPTIGHLMAPGIDWLAVALFYPLYFVGLVVFAIAPSLSAADLTRSRSAPAFARGAFLGLIAYATYDLTNQATLRDWPWHVTVIDMVWGAVVTGTSSGVATALTLATCRRARRTSGR